MSLMSKPALILIPIAIVCGGCGAAPTERAITRAELGEAWPLTVESGVIACADGSSIVFRADGVTYAINGTARRQATARGYRDIEPIQRLTPPGAITARADRFSEADRQAIFADMVHCQRNGAQTGAAAVARAEACRTQVPRAGTLAGNELNLIMTEGAAIGWPPLKPARAGIRPIFNIGLELCRRSATPARVLGAAGVSAQRLLIVDNIELLTFPAVVALYVLFLIVIVAVTVIRAGLLSWRLFGGVSWRQTPIDRVLDGSVPADDLARAALANRVSHETPHHERLAQLRARPRVELDAALLTLRAADARFDHLWSRLAIRASSTWSQMRLVLIAAAFSAAYGIFPTLEALTFGDRAGTGTIAGLPDYIVKALFQDGEWTFARLSLGLAVAGALCVVAMVFDGRLQHRQASWKYFYATARDEISGGQPLE